MKRSYFFGDHSSSLETSETKVEEHLSTEHFYQKNEQFARLTLNNNDGGGKHTVVRRNKKKNRRPSIHNLEEVGLVFCAKLLINDNYEFIKLG